MTTLSPDAAPETTDDDRRRRDADPVLPRVPDARLPGLRGLRALREALDRPLSSYYLLLGASTLLLTIGLMMVLSSSSVDAYKTTGDSYAIVKRQLHVGAARPAVRLHRLADVPRAGSAGWRGRPTSSP